MSEIDALARYLYGDILSIIFEYSQYSVWDAQRRLVAYLGTRELPVADIYAKRVARWVERGDTETPLDLRYHEDFIEEFSEDFEVYERDAYDQQMYFEDFSPGCFDDCGGVVCREVGCSHMDRWYEIVTYNFVHDNVPMKTLPDIYFCLEIGSLAKTILFDDDFFEIFEISGLLEEDDDEGYDSFG